MKRFFVLILAVAAALTLTACGGSKENGSADPGKISEPSEQETGEPVNVEDEPVIAEGESGTVDDEPVVTEGEWLTVDGEFYKFTDLSFVNYFEEFELTFSDMFSDSFSFHSEYLGDDVVEGAKTRHFAVTGSIKGMTGIYLELWFTETGKFVRLGLPKEENGEVKIVTTTDPSYLADEEQDVIDEFRLGNFLMLHGLFAGEIGFEYATLFTDPGAFAEAEYDYVINEISSPKRDFGAGQVTVFHYDYSVPDLFDLIQEIAKIGDKYMFVYSHETYAGDFVGEFNVTRAVPFK